MEYDVFISCKSEDYKLAEEVYQFLVDNGFYTFLSSKELRKMKDSEYMDAISEALDSAYHIIVLSTSKENIKSKWVKFEWSTFLNEQLSGRKQGQIMSILSGMEVRDLPIQLRHYEVFSPKDYQEKILSYIETPAHEERTRSNLALENLDEASVKYIPQIEKAKKTYDYAYKLWMDDRFDKDGYDNMRLAALASARDAMEMGYYEAKSLYDSILKDYPELKDKHEIFYRYFNSSTLENKENEFHERELIRKKLEEGRNIMRIVFEGDETDESEIDYYKDKYLIWLKRAAEYGDVEAMFEYSMNTKSNEDKMNWLRQAAEKGYNKAQYDYGRTLGNYTEMKEKKEETCSYWIQLAAENGCPEAQYDLSQSYRFGFEPYKEDKQKYIKWLKKASELGHLEAIAELGVLIIQENLDVNKGLKLLEASAKEGCATALFELGKLYEEGKVVNSSREMALKLYESAARKHNMDAAKKIIELRGI